MMALWLVATVVANKDGAVVCIDEGQMAPRLVLMMQMTAAVANDDNAAAGIVGCGRWRVE
jgi:hypothetical protein